MLDYFQLQFIFARIVRINVDFIQFISQNSSTDDKIINR